MKAKLITSLVLIATVSSSPAVNIGLFEWATNTNGAISSRTPGDASTPDDPIPMNVDATFFSETTGLGAIRMSITGAGNHFIGFFVDHEIDEADNTFYNEAGSVHGSAGSGLSWEIDEPGWLLTDPGDIYDNFVASGFTLSQLDNTIGPREPEDISMALGWDLALTTGQTALATFLVSETAPSGFYLRQYDPDSQASIYLSSSLRVTGGPNNNVTDGGATFSMLLVGMAGMVLAGTMKKKPCRQ